MGNFARYALALGLALAAVLAGAQVPRTISFQGFLSGSGGPPVTGTVAMTFRLYEAPSGGAALWTEGPRNVQVTAGLFNVTLGEVTPFPGQVNFDRAYHLGVQVGSDAEMAPRTALLAAPYALRSAVAEAVNSGLPTQIGSDTLTTCGSARAGSLRWNPPAAALELCDGSAWRPLSTAAAYTIGGTVSGLAGTVVLRLNGGNDLALSGNGGFTFAVPLANGAAYNVTVLTHPSGQTCLIGGGSGTVSSANVTGVTVSCSGDPSGASAQIAAVRAAPDGAVNLPVANAFVTATKQALGSDVAGFFVQAQASGPALFVAVDPATLSPAPAAGDAVGFTVTQMGTSAGLRQATAITGYSRLGQGNSLAALAQNVTASTDLVSNLSGYESELVGADVSVTGAFAAAGTGFVSAPVSTVGIASDPNLRLRIPASLLAQSGLTAGCTLSLLPRPLWRFNAQAQLSPMSVSDITNVVCPPPTVVSAVATSATGVQVTFSRPISAASVDPSASQFMLTSGLTTSSVSIDGANANLVTSVQATGVAYTVSVAGSVQDIYGAGVGTPNSAQFFGY